MRLRRLLPSALLGATLAGCADLNLTDPNERSTDTFWRTAGDAVAGVNAVYDGLQNNGTVWPLARLRHRPALGHRHDPESLDRSLQLHQVHVHELRLRGEPGDLAAPLPGPLPGQPGHRAGARDRDGRDL